MLNNVTLLNCVDTNFSIQALEVKLSYIALDYIDVSQTIFSIQAEQINLDYFNITNTKPFSKSVDNNEISMININQQNKGGYAHISQSKFINFTISNNNPLISLNGLFNIVLDNVIIKNVVNTQNQYTSIFVIQSCDTVTIIDSQFRNNTNSNGPGGVIYAAENKLISNKAIYSSGGAIYLQNNNLIMQNSVVSSNLAQIGGGIYYTQIVPQLIIDLQNSNQNNNTFKDNVGRIFGQNFGSTLRKVYIDLDYIEALNKILKSIQDGNILIKQFKSGNQINLKKIQLLDEEENPLKLLDFNSSEFSQLSNDVQTLLQQISVSVTWEQENQQIQCVGQLQTKSFTNGGFRLDVQIFYKPMSNMTLKIVSNVFPQIKDSNGNIIVIGGQAELNVQVFMEQCSVGEILMQYGNSIACESCPDGKYSLSQNDNQCKVCPDSALRCIGSNIYLQNGYWRENEDTDNILQCSFNPLSCKPELSTSKFNCDVGYKGPLCQSCDTYGEIWEASYSEILNPGHCYKCQENLVQIIIINLTIFFLIFCYILTILRRIINQLEIKLTGYFLNKLNFIYLGSTLSQLDRSQILSKILTDHLQILSLICTFTFKMPSSFTLPIQISGNPTSLTSKSIDCIFSQYPQFQPLWLLQSLWSFTLPTGIFLLYILIGVIYLAFKINVFLKYLRTAAIFIYIYFFPMIITLTSRSFNCITIGNKKYLDLDLNVECFDKDEHKPFIFCYSIPVILLWGLFIPILLFQKIYQTKQQKKSIIIQIKYSYLFAGYKERFYFWEFWKLFCKMKLILVSVLFKQNIYLKVGAMNTLLLLQFYLLLKSKPYVRKYFNDLQQISTFIYTLSLNLCFLQIINDQNGSEYQNAWIFLVFFINLNFISVLVLGLLKLNISIERRDRNCFQNIIFKIYNKYPQLFDIKIQNKEKIRLLLKVRELKKKIRQMMRYQKNFDFQESLQKHFNQNNLQNINLSPQSIKLTQTTFSEPDEKQNIFKGNNSIKKMRNKWPYYTRNPKLNQIQLKDLTPTNISSSQNTYFTGDYIIEAESPIQNKDIFNNQN
ncbi:transmembrane protein, putative (macronuclear) [Tetrahymena thermophila SB210]|uniref:Transmembrane protein, putative n=2 Tax=Tetrahymena thermophila (strain SB210) TaxID=312017 RepID=W7XES3_TETTS|nr:transmembrane protein, putative [Tetrahymena thermophila SB210]EWS76277.1 transmembrane protein, putative [Tetrahymena thermophila SB210]|eukprot:XP_012651187.1 transmembrane protein, putative [Tetrahymena thermophila SB210]